MCVWYTAIYPRKKVIKPEDIKQRMHHVHFLQSMQVLSIGRASYPGLLWWLKKLDYLCTPTICNFTPSTLLQPLHPPSKIAQGYCQPFHSLLTRQLQSTGPLQVIKSIPLYCPIFPFSEWMPKMALHAYSGWSYNLSIAVSYVLCSSLWAVNMQQFPFFPFSSKLFFHIHQFAPATLGNEVQSLTLEAPAHLRESCKIRRS